MGSVAARSSLNSMPRTVAVAAVGGLTVGVACGYVLALGLDESRRAAAAHAAAVQEQLRSLVAQAACRYPIVDRILKEGSRLLALTGQHDPQPASPFAGSAPAHRGTASSSGSGAICADSAANGEAAAGAGRLKSGDSSLVDSGDGISPTSSLAGSISASMSLPPGGVSGASRASSEGGARSSGGDEKLRMVRFMGNTA